MPHDKTKRLAGWADNFTDPAHFLALGVEELAFHLLARMREDKEHSNWALINAATRLPTQLVNKPKCKEAVSEAWFWLETQSYLIPFEAYKKEDHRDLRDISGVSRGYFRRLTRRAYALDLTQKPAELVKASHYPRDLFHPTLQNDVWPLFVSGKHQKAVSSAMWEVETAARDLGVSKSGSDANGLFGAVFNPKGIMDTSHLGGFDPDNLRSLYASAFACFRNPTVHERVDYDTATAFELLMLAGLLLRIMETSLKNPQ